ncbi:MAG: hypothetical protein ACFCUU_04060 [Cyclobacteriaceae bacterium]
MKPISLIFPFLIFFACNSTDDEMRIDDQRARENPFISESQTDGQQVANQFWRVALFVDDGFDFTRNFENVSFRFVDSGVLEAHAYEKVISGSWKIERDSPLDELYITFSNSSILVELNDDWYIRERGENILVLEYQDDSYKNQLIFVRETNQPTVTAPFNNGKTEMESLFDKVYDSSFSITSLIDDEDNKTHLFSGGSLNFDPLGSVVLAQPNENSWRGFWMIGFNNEAIKLDIDFDYEGIPDYLDEDWLLESQENEVLKFIENDVIPEDFLEITLK